jgi:hypothetical protein
VENDDLNPSVGIVFHSHCQTLVITSKILRGKLSHQFPDFGRKYKTMILPISPIGLLSMIVFKTQTDLKLIIEF